MKVELENYKVSKVEIAQYIDQLHTPDGIISLHSFLGLSANQRADVSGMEIIRKNLAGADFSGAYLMLANFSESNLIEANFSHADLSNATVAMAKLQRANFEGATLKETRFQSSNMEQANFNGADAEKANFTLANLVWANFSHTNLREAKLIGAYLCGADFNGAVLTNASLYMACVIDVQNFTSEQFKLTVTSIMGDQVTNSLEGLLKRQKDIPLDTQYSLAKFFLHRAGTEQDHETKQYYQFFVEHCVKEISDLPIEKQPDEYKQHIVGAQHTFHTKNMLLHFAFNANHIPNDISNLIGNVLWQTSAANPYAAVSSYWRDKIHITEKGKDVSQKVNSITV